MSSENTCPAKAVGAASGGSQAEGMKIMHAGSFHCSKDKCFSARRPAVLSGHARWLEVASQELQQVLVSQWHRSNALQCHLRRKAHACYVNGGDEQLLEGMSRFPC